MVCAVAAVRRHAAGIARKRQLRYAFRHSERGGSAQASADANKPAQREETAGFGELSEPQKRRLSVTCEYIDKLLQDVEQILSSAASKSPFPRYVIDVSPAQTQALEGYISDLRAALLRALAWQQMQPREPDIPASRAVLINLNYIGIAIEELKPRYMRGAGTVPEGAVDELNRVVSDLRVAAEKMERYLLKELGSPHEQQATGEGGSGQTP
jgi:hypothetical protein